MPYYYALTRFGRWEDMLKEPEPPAFSAPLRAVWHYSRGLAFAATKRIDNAETELARVNALMADESMKQAMFSPNATGAALAPAVEVLAGDIAAGRPAEAETVDWEDLRRNRENGWALFGLLQALRAQNKTADAALTEARFKAAWARADVALPASRFGRM